MTTPADDGPDFALGSEGFGPDDPLVHMLRPSTEYLGPPPGRYEAIRRGAARRKLLRAAAGAGLVCAVAALVVLPLRLAASDDPASPTVPLAPPPASSPARESATPTPTQAPTPTPTPSPSEPVGTPYPSPSAVPSQFGTTVPSVAPSEPPTSF
ncbi:hypothetical protein ACIHIX_42675 [Streptomyces sp. NPDC051913]|uniref:hypothetical protein n=1 Tax=Streptomyces sp. NPDC051913 TaxID=3365676 RepID=UPI0037D4187B